MFIINNLVAMLNILHLHTQLLVCISMRNIEIAATV